MEGPALLLVIAPLIGAETYHQMLYFLNLKGDVITSCCGSMFSADEEGVAAGLAALPPVPMGAAFFGILAVTLAAQGYPRTEIVLSGGLVKTPALGQLVADAFNTIGDGALTDREGQIVELTLRGHSSKAIGRLLSISPGTVRIHRRNVYSKLRINSQGELFSLFLDTIGAG